MRDGSVSEAEEKAPTANETKQPQRWLLPVVFLLVGLVGGGAAMWFLRPAAKPPSAAAEKGGAEKTAADKPASDKPGADAPDTVQLSAAALERAQVKTVEVTKRSLTQPLAASGRIQINEDASVRVGTPVEGRVSKVLVKVGDTVRAGQTVVLVHSHELAQAQADHAKARVAIKRAEKNLAYAHAEKARADRLLEAKAISVREQMRATADVNAATAELEAARAEMRRAEEFLHHLGASAEGAEDVPISAPMGGVVLKRNVTVGTVVNPATDLLTIANLSSVWAVAEVPEKQASAVRAGLPVQLTVAAFGDRPVAGRVTYIGETLNPETRTVQVRCLIQNPNGQLRPEMYVVVNIDTGQSAPLLVVPREAVNEVKGERVVFVATGKDTFEKKPVQTGREQGEWVEVVSGLSEGQRVVTRGGFFIKSAFLKGSMAEE